ncbi:MAG: pyruvate formate-lyase-activating protein [Defluviitaleaceae bacterium]|nr:pyruvate formate-lyase-activating protein [Defluviitaleaceae bacterium]
MSESKEIIGRIHSVETCGTVDGPGIRYIIFMQGCPLRCLYCHNPDSWNINSASAKEMTVSDLMADIRKYKSFMRFSGGGVTVSGGEPLMQHEFVTKLFKACQKEGINTTLDTSGFADLEIVSPIFEYTNLILLDIKSYNEETYKNLTGAELTPTLKFLNHTKEIGLPVWVRFVLVPGITDNIADIKEMAKFLSSFENIKKVDILPFHKMGEHKWELLKIDYQLKNTRSPSKFEVDKVKDIFAKYSL